MPNEKRTREDTELVELRCPDCGYDNKVRSPIDRHKLYECELCLYQFSLGGT